MAPYYHITGSNTRTATVAQTTVAVHCLMNTALWGGDFRNSYSMTLRLLRRLRRLLLSHSLGRCDGLLLCRGRTIHPTGQTLRGPHDFYSAAGSEFRPRNSPLRFEFTAALAAGLRGLSIKQPPPSRVGVAEGLTLSRFACSRRPASLRLGLVGADIIRPLSPSLRSIRAAHGGSDAYSSAIALAAAMAFSCAAGGQSS